MRINLFEGVRLKKVKKAIKAKAYVCLAHLLIEGRKHRATVAQLFWPEKSDKRGNLSKAMSNLRSGLPMSLEGDPNEIWPSKAISTDVAIFEAACRAKRFELALKFYTGPFLAGVEEKAWMRGNAELEEWVIRTRERLANLAREAFMYLAEWQAAQGNHKSAASLAGKAYKLSGAKELEPEEFKRYHVLFVAGQSDLAEELEREAAEELGIHLSTLPNDAITKSQHLVVGRDRELKKLHQLPKGHWVWLQGGARMGKTYLLTSLEGTYLPARSGYPLASLEPLLGDTIREGPEASLQKLRTAQGIWLLDDWEEIDLESRQLLTRLHKLRPPRLRVIISSRQAPAFKVDAPITLTTLTAEALAEYPGAWEKTQGLPDFVGAYLRNEPLEQALEGRSVDLNDVTFDIYLCLALMDDPDLTLVREALGLSAETVHQAQDVLIKSGLIDAWNRVRARRTALEYIDLHSGRVTPLALKLARKLSLDKAFSLYRRARSFWQDEDIPRARSAYVAQVKSLLWRKFPKHAVEVINELPEPLDATAQLLKGQVLESVGLYREALAAIEGLEETSEVAALKGSLLWRLGQPSAADRLAKQALKGDKAAEAAGLNVLGHLARDERRFEDAEAFYHKAATAWYILGETGRRGLALSNLATTRYNADKEHMQAFMKALDVATDIPPVKVAILNNLGHIHEQQGKLDEAERTLREVIKLASEVGTINLEAYSWNNLGVLHHNQNDKPKAEEAYEQALGLARQTGDAKVLSDVLSNLGELNEDEDLLEEAYRLAKEAGLEADAEEILELLPKGHRLKKKREVN